MVGCLLRNSHVTREYLTYYKNFNNLTVYVLHPEDYRSLPSSVRFQLAIYFQKNLSRVVEMLQCLVQEDIDKAISIIIFRNIKIQVTGTIDCYQGRNIYVISLQTLSNHSRSNLFQLRRPVDHKKTRYFSFILLNK